MYISEVRMQDFRCFERVLFSPGEGLNLIVGDNASGKSSLLEALFYLGRGHSFRRTAASRIIRDQQKSFTLNAQIETEQRRSLKLGIQREPGNQRIKVGTRDNAAILDLVNALPLQIIDPNLHRLLEEGPHYRRRYLDWGVFHVEHGFFPAWRRYQRALKQRNSALRAGLAKTSVIVWDNEFVQAGLAVDACRRGYIDSLTKILPALVGEILGGEEVRILYQPGWAKDQDLGSALARSLDSDQRAGFTHVGPHRADLRVRVGSVSARDWVSRGQQKVVTAVLLLAQAMLLDKRRQLKPVLLIDDLAAELGGSYRKALINVVQRLQGQCFMTFLDESLIPNEIGEMRMFHVEHGRLRQSG